MRRNGVLLALVVALLALLAAAGGSAAPDGTARSGTGARLQSFGSCGNLLAYARKHTLPLVGAWGFGGAPGATGGLPAAATSGVARAGEADTSGVDFSTTNVQEEGVDEPDIVKSNGSTLFVVRGDRLFAVDVRGTKPKLAGALQLPASMSYELLLHGERLLVLSRGGVVTIDAQPGGVSASSSLVPYRQQTNLIEVDVGDPSAPRIVRSLTLDADYVSARLVGTVARIVTVSGMPHALPFVTPADSTPEATAAALARNRAVVRTARLGSWVPSYKVKGRRGETLVRRPLVQCRNVRRPAVYSGLGLVTVLTVDLRKGLAPIDSDSVVADGRTVYASRDSLYVATQRWLAQPVTEATSEPPRVTTAIHKFDISDPASTTYRGSGTVSGYLLSQWSLSEHKGVLRVASTEAPAWWGTGQEESESAVTTLGERDGALVQLGRVAGLGKGERVYAVRFIGDTGYVVTFRQVDPLYTLDLSTPARPAVLGELKIQGYSAYLHPLGDDLLLGIGQDATAEGRVLGTQLSLFDVSDLRRPARLRQQTLGSSWSEAEGEHHAFLWWAPSRLAVIPVTTYADKPFAGAVGFRVTRTGIDEVGRVTHTGEAAAGASGRVGAIPVNRSLVVGDTLYTVSSVGVKAVSLESFAEQGWVPFGA
jgi:uncharacterized secreted protein with C-terminal beta-propeller domain